jgi:hypothetical protein
MQEVRIFARLPDGSLRVAKREHDSPGWQWPIATGISGPSAFNGDVVLSVAGIAELPTSPGQIGVV